ncbi:MAG: hypothetical protein M3N42_00530, partial [Cyanobacteriota bacterium]|nr:hypothetical protein [Cyanobacteriota bacterium]
LRVELAIKDEPTHPIRRLSPCSRLLQLIFIYLILIGLVDPTNQHFLWVNLRCSHRRCQCSDSGRASFQNSLIAILHPRIYQQISPFSSFLENKNIKIHDVLLVIYRYFLSKFVGDGLTKAELCGNLVENLLNY